MQIILASGNPFEIVVLPILFFLGILAAGACLLVGMVAIILAIVFLSQRKVRKSGDE